MSQDSQVIAEHTSESAHTGHPTPLTYFKVAMVLSIITAIEVGVFYLEFVAREL